MSLVLLERLQSILKPQQMEAQCGFRQRRSTLDQIWVVRQVIEKATEYRTPVHLCFVDLTKAYDSVDRTELVAALRSYGVPHQLVGIIQEFHTDTRCHVRTHTHTHTTHTHTTHTRAHIHTTYTHTHTHTQVHTQIHAWP